MKGGKCGGYFFVVVEVLVNGVLAVVVEEFVVLVLLLVAVLFLDGLLVVRGLGRGRVVEEGDVEGVAEAEAEVDELVLDFVEGLFAEVAVLEHVVLGLEGELADGGDVGVVEAVGGADGELDFVDAHVEDAAEAVALLVGGELGARGVAGLQLVRVVDEDVEVVAEDGGGGFERGVGVDAAVGPDVKDELFVVGHLADAGVFGVEVDARDGGEDGVDGDAADFLLAVLVVLGGAESAAGADFDLHVEGGVGVEGGDALEGVEDFDGVVRGEVRGGDDAGAFFVELEPAGVAGLAFEEDALEVEDDVRDVLRNPGERAKFVGRALDSDGGDGHALDGGEQHAAQAVAQGAGVPDLEGLGDVPGVVRLDDGFVADDLFRHFEAA